MATPTVSAVVESGARSAVADGGGPAMRRARPLGALDLGTNNCRMLIARPAGDRLEVLDAFSRVVRLGEGLENHGRLAEAAMDRTVEALALCAERLRRHGVAVVRSVATEACRRAANAPAFLKRVFDETGLALDVISAEEEARLALKGCEALIDDDADGVLVFDIGGGSTELVWARREGGGWRVVSWRSLPCGVISLYDRLGRAPVDALLPEVERLLEGFAPPPGLKRVQLTGTSGTITTLAALQLGLMRYDRREVDGAWLDLAALEMLARQVGDWTQEECAAVPAIGPDRAELMPAGAAILVALLRQARGLPTGGRVRVADRGLREGVLRSLVVRSDGR